MAKSKLDCPYCSSKLDDPGDSFYPNHTDSAGSLCPLSARPIEGREGNPGTADAGPVKA